MTTRAGAYGSGVSAATHYRTAMIDGVSIFYREAGPKDAPVVLLLHGFPSSSRMFRAGLRVVRKAARKAKIPLNRPRWRPLMPTGRPGAAGWGRGSGGS